MSFFYCINWFSFFQFQLQFQLYFIFQLQL